MTQLCCDPNVLKPSHPFLELVRSFITLIDRSDKLIYGRGLKAFYAMKAGLVTFNDDDILAIVSKADSEGMIPKSLDGFLNRQIYNNCSIYASVLQTMIEDRILSISNGDVVNPPAQVMSSTQAARRAYYLPSNQLIGRLRDAIVYCDMPDEFRFRKADTLQDVRQDMLLFLMNQEGRAGHSIPNATSFGLLVSVVSDIVGRIASTSDDSYSNRSYKDIAVPGLQIIWIIAKLLYGDLRPATDRGDINEVDIFEEWCFEDGTLAAIPFPSKPTISLFQDYGSGKGISMKGRFYLNAVSKAAFMRVGISEE